MENAVSFVMSITVEAEEGGRGGEQQRAAAATRIGLHRRIPSSRRKRKHDLLSAKFVVVIIQPTAR